MTTSDTMPTQLQQQRFSHSPSSKPGESQALRCGEAPPPFQVRLATCHDIPAFVAIHAAGLPGEFLVRLGIGFLTRVFYPTLLQSSRTRVFVADDGRHVLGFIIIRAGLGGVLSEMFRTQRFWVFATCVAGFIRRPTLAFDTLGIMAQLRARETMANTDVAELFLLAVDPAARRCGVGRTLIEHSAVDLKSRGIASYRVWLHADNAPADAVYQATGFAERQVRRFGRHLWRERERLLRRPVGTRPPEECGCL